MIKIIYFVHGTTVDNESDISSGWSDANLSQLGIEQSIKLKDLTKDLNLDVVFCSDLKRAIDSANLVFANRRISIIPDARLRECNYGKFNGKSSEIVEPMQEKSVFDKFPSGESCEDVKNRVNNFLEYLKQNYEGKTIAIVAHKAPQLALDVLLKGKSWEEAFAEDWRITKSWQPGWEYILE